MRLVHLSDLHFGRHDSAVVEGLARELESQNADLIVVSGDFTQVGSVREFAQAREFLDSLHAPVFAVPGNHDVPQRDLFLRFIAPYSRYRRYIGFDLEPFHEDDTVAIAGLKTSRRANWRSLNWSDGAISRDQLDRLGDRFAKVPAHKVRIVVAHHPLLHPEEPMAHKQRRVRRADRALETFAQLGVRLVLSGHFHMSYVRRHEHAGEIRHAAPTGPRRAAAAPILVAQAASTTSTRLRGHPNAYNRIDIRDGTITIDVREWGESGWVTREKAQQPG
ncbi:metallophosphoesterase family protein [Pelagibacterium xiamenense]|uniref:metallophosphoesterase family protein n=1 Tax=Pelagibacterium xiamenense TaxID=2901140 RepID=UPI001E3F32E7|nr:metallophosphoesterase [Pelagibacterium xiamenense]MCD7059686.1 metallophosphoesterase [Pelagibacterium xiamenense]